MLGISCVNTTEGLLLVGELSDNEFFTELEAVIAQINPRECIIPVGETPELVTLRNVIERNGVLLINVKKSEFTSDDINQDLNRLLYFLDGQKRDASVFPETNLKEAMCSLQAVIKHLNLTGNEQNFNQFKISSLNVHQYVRLDNAAISALNLLPKPGLSINNTAAKFSSVLGVLDNCCTPQGHRLLEQWIKQPIKDINLMNERLDVVEALVCNSEIRQVLHENYLTRIPDLLMLAKKLGNKKASLQDCYRIYQTVNGLSGMVGVLRKLENNHVKAMLIEPVCELLNDMDKFQSMIEQTLDMDLVDRGEFLIKPNYDDELQGIVFLILIC